MLKDFWISDKNFKCCGRFLTLGMICGHNFCWYYRGEIVNILNIAKIQIFHGHGQILRPLTLGQIQGVMVIVGALPPPSPLNYSN